jgi:hypothetical protein
MRKLIIVIFCLAFLAGLNGCKKEVIYSKANCIIEFGSECGWCAGQEFITITSFTIEFEKTIPCGENQGTEKKSKSITSTKWDSIRSSFDYSLFKTLEYDECNVCVDGCDEIIRITKNDESHQIRYSPEKQIEEIEELRQILAELLSEFNTQD